MKLYAPNIVLFVIPKLNILKAKLSHAALGVCIARHNARNPYVILLPAAPWISRA